MQPLSLIFPMAGQGARFGYRFKPFLEVGGRSFIEAAFAPFRAWLPHIEKTCFIVTADQDRAHDVRGRLAAMFADVPHDTVVLDRPTAGPAQTLRQCLETKAISGPVIACDCDHAVNVDGLMQATETGIACAIPTWPLDGEAISAWGVAATDKDGRITAVAEKALPAQGENFRGLIGCYYFADAARVRRSIAEGGMIHLSDVIAHYLDIGLPVLSVPVRETQFFGDPARLAKAAAVS